jgi:hypothetical protein
MQKSSAIPSSVQSEIVSSIGFSLMNTEDKSLDVTSFE